MANTKTAWLSAYLYYSPPWESFLVEAVSPFVEDSFRKKFATQFFFIRYFKKGPHIRLRFKGDAKTLATRLKPYLLDYFRTYLAKHPSKSVKSMYLKTGDWFPNNSIQFIAYQPEIQRYGGPLGILLAEEYFEASSYAVLGALRDPIHWAYGKRLGLSLQFHIAFLHASGMTHKELLLFLESLLLSTKRLLKLTTPINDYAKHIRKEKEHVFVQLHSQWIALENNVCFKESWYNEWVKKTGEILHKLKSAEKNNNLRYTKFISILGSYMHMTNNRLGINTVDEPFIAYILRRVLDKIYEK